MSKSSVIRNRASVLISISLFLLFSGAPQGVQGEQSDCDKGCSIG